MVLRQLRQGDTAIETLCGSDEEGEGEGNVDKDELSRIHTRNMTKAMSRVISTRICVAISQFRQTIAPTKPKISLRTYTVFLIYLKMLLAMIAYLIIGTADWR